MISTISMVEVGEEFFTYSLMYNNRKYEQNHTLPFEAMSFDERQKFINGMYVQAFEAELDHMVKQRPDEAFEEMTGVNPEDLLEDDEEEEEDVEPQHIIDILNGLVSRIEDIEIKINKDDTK